MVYFFYTALYYALAPLIVLRLLYRAWRAPAYRARIGERFGFFAAPQFTQAPIWIHAVSVGETLAAVPLVKVLLERYPALPIVMTTMTPTGSERVRAAFGERVFHVYAPYDMPDAIARFLRRVKPQLAIIMETELWPNTIAKLRASNVPVVVANARLSQKSARGYARVAALTRPMLENLDVVAAQTAADAERYTALGLPHSRVQVTGSIKFDVSLNDDLQRQARELRVEWGATRQVVIGASTHDGEEQALLDAYKTLKTDFPALLLVLVPRHPERFESVAQQIKSAGLVFARRSLQQQVNAPTDVLLADTMGEMLLLLGASDIAFVGGSLIARGGHNMLEPAAWGLPIVTGMSDFNFAEASTLLQQQGALVKVDDTRALVIALSRWLRSDGARSAAGDAARAVVENNKGALGRLLSIIAARLPR